jgi:hypothetical protein
MGTATAATWRPATRTGCQDDNAIAHLGEQGKLSFDDPAGRPRRSVEAKKGSKHEQADT